MSERLTDEQLRDWRDGKVDLYREQCVETAGEIIALRAKLEMIGNLLNEYANAKVTLADVLRTVRLEMRQ